MVAAFVRTRHEFSRELTFAVTNQLKMNFEFATATRIVFGAGAIQHVGANTKDLGRSALVVTGRDPSRAAKLLASLSTSGIRATTFNVASEPEIFTVENGVALAKKENCDFVIAF